MKILQRGLLTTTFLTCGLLMAAGDVVAQDTKASMHGEHKASHHAGHSKEHGSHASHSHHKSHSHKHDHGKGSHHLSSHVPAPAIMPKARVIGEVNFQYAYNGTEDAFKDAAAQKDSLFNTQYSLGGELEVLFGASTRVGGVVNMKYTRDKEYRVALGYRSNSLGSGGLALYQVDEGHYGGTGGSSTTGPISDGTGQFMAFGSPDRPWDTGFVTPALNILTVAPENVLTNSPSGNAITNPEGTQTTAGSVTKFAEQEIGLAGEFGYLSGYGHGKYLHGDPITVPMHLRHIFEAHVFMEGPFGRVELGQVDGAEEKMRLDASTIAVGSGGINGDWSLYADLSGDMTTPDLLGRIPRESTVSYIDQPGMYSPVALIKAPKVSYYTPSVGGFKAGISYTVDQGDNTRFRRFSTENDADYKNVVAGGIGYDAMFNNFALRFSAIGEMAKAEKLCSPIPGDAAKCAVNHYDLESWGVGGVVEFAGLNVAASYGNLGKSGLRKDLTYAYDSTRDYANPKETVRGVPSSDIAYIVTGGTSFNSRATKAALGDLAVATGSLPIMNTAGNDDATKGFANSFGRAQKGTLAGNIVTPAPDSSIPGARMKDFQANETGKLKDSYYVTAGAGYDIGPFGLSVSYMYSKAAQTDRAGGRTKLQTVAGGLDYEVAKGMILYAEATYFKSEDKTYATATALEAIGKGDGSGGVVQIAEFTEWDGSGVGTASGNPNWAEVPAFSYDRFTFSGAAVLDSVPAASAFDDTAATATVGGTAGPKNHAPFAHAGVPSDAKYVRTYGGPVIRPGEVYKKGALPKDNEGFILMVGSKLSF